LWHAHLTRDSRATPVPLRRCEAVCSHSANTVASTVARSGHPGDDRRAMVTSRRGFRRVLASLLVLLASLPVCAQKSASRSPISNRAKSSEIENAGALSGFFRALADVSSGRRIEPGALAYRKEPSGWRRSNTPHRRRGANRRCDFVRRSGGGLRAISRACDGPTRDDLEKEVIV
jgi:hypothetical protein